MGDFGGKLRQARERRGISLRQIAAATKISVGVLEALERNDIAKLPGGIFSRAFVRSYAAEVGLDPDETVRDFLAEFPSESTGAAHAGGASPSPHQAHHLPHGPADLSALAPDENHFDSQPSATDVVRRLMLFGIPIALLILYLSMRGGAPPPAPGVEAAPPSSPPPPNPTMPPSEIGAETPAETPQTASKAQALTIDLRPTAECWVSLAIDGAPSISRTMQGGEREVHRFREEVVLTVGNGAACAFLLNGRPARLLAGEGQARKVTITRQNLAKYLP